MTLTLPLEPLSGLNLFRVVENLVAAPRALNAIAPGKLIHARNQRRAFRLARVITGREIFHATCVIKLGCSLRQAQETCAMQHSTRGVATPTS